MSKFERGDKVSYKELYGNTSCRVVGVSLKAPYVYSVRDIYNIKISNIPESCLKREHSSRGLK